VNVDRKACEACGRPFSEHKLRKRPRFCNHQCLSAWYSTKFEGIDHQLIAAYESGRSTKEVAKQFDLSYTQVRQRLIKLGVTLRTPGQAAKLATPKLSKIRKGKKHRPRSEETRRKMAVAKAGKGKGRSPKRAGYVMITMGEHKYRGEHTVIMEQILGRRLRPGEEVHHKDGDKHNNDPSNLELLTKAEHARLHRRREHGRRMQNQLSLDLTT
jgi:transposase-like protein